MLHYSIKPKNLGAHLIQVVIEIPAGEKTVVAKLPKWIPGSYKIRDYSRNIQGFIAKSGDSSLTWKKKDSDTWVIASKGRAVTLIYDVYAYELSVRGAYLDDTRMFFNHCCVCLDIIHLSSRERSIDIQTIDNWRIFTALDKNKEYYIASNYEHQIDCPVESAEKYLHSTFSIGNVCHEVIFTGDISDNYDLDLITKNLEKICKAETSLFEGSPLDKYLFMTYIEHNQYGGLEHKNSVAQLSSPNMIIQKNKKITDKMIDFMGLCSHEYFHLWNVKRLQPKDFMPYDLYREQNTEMLWMFEGFTSYYDEIFLLRAGIIDSKKFLQRQAQNISRVLNIPGRLLQPLASSSFDAWTKLYQADENSPNSMVSYYTKGAVFSLYLDLFIRKYSEGKSLDDVMRYLWENYGKKRKGIDEDIVFNACARLLPEDKQESLAIFFIKGLHDIIDIDIKSIISDFGVKYESNADKTDNKEHTSDSGMKITIENSKARINFLDSLSHAAEQGVSVGDKILSINNKDANATDFREILNLGLPGNTVNLLLSRRGRVFKKNILLKEPKKNKISLTLTDKNKLSDNWLFNHIM